MFYPTFKAKCMESYRKIIAACTPYLSVFTQQLMLVFCKYTSIAYGHVTCHLVTSHDKNMHIIDNVACAHIFVMSIRLIISSSL